MGLGLHLVILMLTCNCNLKCKHCYLIKDRSLYSVKYAIDVEDTIILTLTCLPAKSGL